MTLETEVATERDRRRYQRELLAGFVAATAGAGPGAVVLEVGCGTGQLTEELSRRLSGQAEVGLTLEAQVTMARARRPASGG